MTKATKRPIKRAPTSARVQSNRRTRSFLNLGSRFSLSRPLIFATGFAVIGVVLLFTALAAPKDNGVKVEKFKDNPAAGLSWKGLSEPSAGSVCVAHDHSEDLLEMKDNNGKHLGCTHGPDPAPAGIDARQSVQPLQTGENDATAASTTGGSATAQSAPGIVCDGDGVSGNRIQALYVHASNATDRYSQFATSFPQYAARANNFFVESSAQTGGNLNLRFVTDANCNLSVGDVTVSPTGVSSLGATESELEAQGYNRTDRKYLLWEDATVYCGIADIQIDDQPGPANANNSGPSFARVDSGCWNYSEPHELMHTLGGVQLSAPHSTGAFHCDDEYDDMCYNDGGPTSTQIISCSNIAEQSHFDCNKDDYFYAGTPPPGNYLATHWDTANNVFLINGGSSTPPPPGDTIAPVVSISSPVSNSIVGSTVSIKATATDNVGVTKMQIYLDGQLKATSSTGAISYSWNSKKASRGTHTITVKAYDAAGNVGQSSVSVIK